ncbi:MAG TPA: hypothetical protein VF297_16315 [Pyrinomonadaceae bacterium]
MNNPVCADCGHVNLLGAASCEMCDARLYTPDDADGADSFGDAREPFDSSREPFGSSYEPFDSSRESSWSASDTSARGGDWSPAYDIPAPPFKGADDVIHPMLAVYRKHFTLVGILVLVTTVPEALLQYGFISAARTGGPVSVANAGSVGAAIASGVLIWLLALAGAALLSGSLTYAVVDVQRAGGASAGDALARGLKALPRVFVVSVLYAVITILGYVMLIVPGVIFSLMFAVCVPATVVEGLGPIAALKRSAELTKGYKGLIFITFFLWGLLVTILGWVITWSFTKSNLDMLPTLLLQTAILGMLSSSSHVLTIYVYLGLLSEHRSGFQTTTFTSGPEATA